MKKKDIILISIIIILIISLVGTIIYYNKDKSITIEAEILIVGSNYLLVTSDNQDYVINTEYINYKVGDILKLELTNIKKNNTPYEATAKNIKLLKSNTNEEETNTTEKDNITSSTTNNSNKDNNQTSESKENYTESEVISYFENLDNEITTYNNEETLGKSIKSKFVKCIDFLFYDEEIGGKTFSELTNSTKLKVLSISLSIDSKIDSKFPGYKESISSSYQNIKNKIVEKYLETTTTICNNDPDLCITAKEGFKDLKDNFGLTWDVIKDIASSGVSKLKDWYEIWKYK